MICPDLVHIQLSLLKSTQVYPLIHWSICIYHMRVRNRVPKRSVPQTVLSLLNCHNWTHTPLSNTSMNYHMISFISQCYPHQFPVVTSPEHILKILMVRMSHKPQCLMLQSCENPPNPRHTAVDVAQSLLRCPSSPTKCWWVLWLNPIQWIC